MKEGSLMLHVMLVFICCVQVRSECNEIISFGLLDIYGPVSNQFGACSGNGQCLNDTCVCNDGWTGRSDWVNTEGSDCHVNETVIKALWGLNVFLCLVCQALGLPLVYSRWESFKKTRLHFRSMGRTYSLWEARPLLACFVHFGLVTPPIILMGILRIADDQERVGLTAGVTTLFVVAKSAFYIAGWLFQPALLQLMITAELNARRNEFNSILRLANLGGGIGAAVSVGIGYLSIPVIFDNSTGKLLFALYLILILGTLIWYCLQAFIIIRRTNKVFNASPKESGSSAISPARNKILKMQKSIIRQLTAQSVIFMVFLFVPFMGNKHDYLLPISWIAYIVLGYTLASTYVDPRKSSQDRSASNATLKGRMSSLIIRKGSKTKSSENVDERTNSKTSVKSDSKTQLAASKTEDDPYDL